jgi:glycosyltransferase involved in cell wall biosynthesis
MSALDLGARPASTTSSATARGSATPTISVIVPHFNDLANLRACLHLLKAQTLPADDFEIIVADNDSACGIDAVRAVCGDVMCLHVRERGAAAARNAAVAQSRGLHLAFIDSDCRPAPDWLERGLAALREADMAGGQVDVTVGNDRDLTAVEAFERVFAFNNERYVKAEAFSVTANMVCPRAIFDTVGGFRASVAEDKDFGQRAAAKGFRWTYAPDMRVAHPARRDWADLCAKWRRLTGEAYNIERQKPAGRLRWLIRAWAMPLSPFVHALPVLWCPKLHRFRDKLNAIGILFRIRWWRFIEAHRILIGGPASV